MIAEMEMQKITMPTTVFLDSDQKSPRAAEFEENMSTHYGRMVHLDDRTIMFANPEDAAEYIGFDLEAV